MTHSKEELIKFQDFLLCSDVSQDIKDYSPLFRKQQRQMSKKCVDIPANEVKKDVLDLVMCVNHPVVVGHIHRLRFYCS